MLDHELDDIEITGGNVSRQKDDNQAVEYDSAADHSIIENVLKAIGPLLATAAVKAATTRDKTSATVAGVRAAAVSDDSSEMSIPLAEQARAKVQPLAEQAKERIQPLAAQAKDQGQALAAQAKDQGQALAAQAKDRGQNLAGQAKDQGVHLTELLAPLAAVAAAQAGQAKDLAVPLAQSAQERVQPAVDTARARVTDDLVPSLLDLLHQAEAHPAVSEATSRGKATVAALKGEIAVPEPEAKGSAAARVAKVAAAGAVLAAVAVAVRTFLGSKDDEWTAHQPSSAYVPGDEDVTLDEAETEPTSDVDLAEAGAAGVDENASTVPDDRFASGASPDQPAAPLEETKVDHSSEEETEREAVMADEGGITDDSETVAEDVNALNEYGEGAYVGDEAPAGYVIKGNERSMKYHTPGSTGYDRTIPDVWFSSVEAAEKAGFSQAQR
ncbi:MAG TPA: hypothetical protein H9987_07875 [Candidatus Luteococcus avicola]|nr:hypothetical protein [Candidatus Luteococcus avicola]